MSILGDRTARGARTPEVSRQRGAHTQQHPEWRYPYRRYVC